MLWSNVERFGILFQHLQAVVPRGSKYTPVRMQRTRRLEDTVAGTLGQTMGAETDVLVMIDPAELPRS